MLLIVKCIARGKDGSRWALVCNFVEEGGELVLNGIQASLILSLSHEPSRSRTVGDILGWLGFQSSENHLLEAFAKLDKNGDGYLSASELAESAISLGQNLTDQEVLELLREADTDGDGQVSFEEFKESVKRHYR